MFQTVIISLMLDKLTPKKRQQLERLTERDSTVIKSRIIPAVNYPPLRVIGGLEEKSLQARLISLSHQTLVLTADGATLHENARVHPVVIGTLECSTSSRPCSQWLNSSEGKEQCCWQLQETSCNIDDVGHALSEGGRLLVSLLSFNKQKWRKMIT